MIDARDPAGVAAAAGEFRTYIDGLIAERLERPGDDLLSGLLSATVDGHTLSLDEVRSFTTVVFGAGFETTADAISGLFQLLIERPDVLPYLRLHLERVPALVEEVLRLVTPIQIFGRNATLDLELCGRQAKAGDIVALGFGSANRDETVFPDPDSLDLQRETNPHLTFGAGVHLCLGAPVARMELELVVRAMLDGVGSLAMAPGATLEWKTRGDRRGLVRLDVAMGPRA